MIGGLMKTTSRLAILAAAGLFATSAQAADLGGNCCTDLEERVAELEATAARKGNRRVSLTVYGHVNEMMMWWDDGFESNWYQGTNDDSRTRFGFKGKANIGGGWSAGYKIEIGIRTHRSDRWDQDDVANVDQLIDMRKASWYVQSKTYGRLTVGRESTADSGITTINLARVNAPRFDDFNDRMLVRDPTGAVYAGITYDDTVSPWSYNPPSSVRKNGIRYDSPTFAGFTFSSTYADDDYWSVALRYANEFNGIRFAAGIAYGWHNDPDQEDGCTAVAGNADCEAWGIGASVMHVPTGLFVSAGYGEVKDNNRGAVATAIDDEEHHWVVTFGMERKFFALGKTTIYATYYESENNRGEASGSCAGGFCFAANETWAIGINQQVSAAAMDLYLSYYNVSVDLQGVGGVAEPTEDFDAVIMGAKIRF